MDDSEELCLFSLVKGGATYRRQEVASIQKKKTQVCLPRGNSWTGGSIEEDRRTAKKKEVRTERQKGDGLSHREESGGGGGCNLLKGTVKGTRERKCRKVIINGGK